MYSKAGVSTLEGVQSAFAKRVLNLGRAQVAHAYLRAELGLWPVQLRVVQATLSLFGQLSRMPESRLAGHVFRHRHAEVAAGGSGAAKYSWCRVARDTLVDAGFSQAWADGSVGDDWKTAMREYCDRRHNDMLRQDVAACSSLELFRRVGRFSGVDPWLKLEWRHPGRALKVRLRAGALPLMVHVGVANRIKERRWRLCVMCNLGAVETEEHFVAECPFYADLRAGCWSRLRSVCEQGATQMPPVDFLSLVAGSASSSVPGALQLRVEKCAWDFLRLAWTRREAIWRRVCLHGDPWRLPAPR